MKNLETEEKKYLSDKLSDWRENHKKLIYLIAFILYSILAIAFVISIVNGNGGMQATLHGMNDYPEQEYRQLEQELQNIIVENVGIYPEKLSKDNIRYNISYEQYNDFEGEYKVELTDTVTVTATIGKDLKKEDLKIERGNKTEKEYRRSQWLPMIVGIILIPAYEVLILYVIILILYSVILIIEFFIKLYNKNKAKKN